MGVGGERADGGGSAVQAVRPAVGMGRRRRRDNISEEMPCDYHPSVKCEAVNKEWLSRKRVSVRGSKLRFYSPKGFELVSPPFGSPLLLVVILMILPAGACLNNEVRSHQDHDKKQR